MESTEPITIPIKLSKETKNTYRYDAVEEVSPQVSITSWKCAKNQVVVQRKCAESSWR